MNTLNPDTREAARELIECGVSPVPLPPRQKGPRIPRWQERTFTPADFPEGANIGAKLGTPSNGLVDVDLDHPMARELADQYLPATGATFGRGGAVSHRLYLAPGAATKKWTLPKGVETNGHATTVEIRSDGCQTMFPPSIHPCGERVEWYAKGEPAAVTPDELHKAVDALHRAVVATIALRAAFKPVAEARDGERNNTLNETAFIVGRRVSAGEFPHELALAEALRAADMCGEDAAKARDTAERALADGAKSAPTVAQGDAVVILPSGSVTLTEAAEAIFSRMKRLYTRGGVPSEIVSDELGMRVEPLRAQAFRSKIESLGAVMKWGTGPHGEPVLRPAQCSKDIAEALLATDAARKHLPAIVGLVSAPVIMRTANGPEVLRKGFHAEHGLLVTGGVVDDVPLAEALPMLAEIFEGFDFVTEGDRARAYAMLLSPAMRIGSWIERECPAHIIEADQSQSGKGYMTKLVLALYGERPYEIALRQGGVGGLDESFSAALLAARQFIRIDNVRGKLDSQFIEAVMTADGPAMCRTPGRPELPVEARHFTLLFTSNGLESTPDFANRSSIIRIRKRTRATFKQYAAGDILDHVRANRAAMLGAVHAIIRAWHDAGCPSAHETRHDFRQWAGALSWIVRHVIGLSADLMDGHTSAKERVANPALTWLRQVALAVEAENKLGTELYAGTIAELCAEHGIDLPGLRPDASDADRNRRVGILMKKCITDGDAVTVDRHAVTRRTGEKYYEAEQQRKTVHVYVVSLETPENKGFHRKPELPEKTLSQPRNVNISIVEGGSIPVLPVTPPAAKKCGVISFRRAPAGGVP